MSPNAAKFALPAVVVAVAIYWIWPHMVIYAPKAKAKKSAQSLEFTAAMLKPTFPPLSKRDPFQAPEIAPTDAETAKSDKTGAKTDEAKPIELVLNATCIVGNKRLAIINGQLYERKDTIGGAETASPYVVADILPDKVYLDHHGTSVLLEYKDATAGKPSGSPTHAKSPAGASTSDQSGGESTPNASTKSAKAVK